MPKLENPKHEEFALLLARGVKQGEAYIKAGYSENKGAASRIASSPRVQDRVEELKREIAQKVQTAMTSVTESNWESLADMGLTYEWVAAQYSAIYEASMEAGSFSSANTAVQNIQKLIDIEKNAKGGEEEAKEDKISVKDTLALLKGMKEVMRDAAEASPEPVMIDITPEDSE